VQTMPCISIRDNVLCLNLYYVLCFFFLCHIFHLERKNGLCSFYVLYDMLDFMSCFSFRNKNGLFFPFVSHA
jgi:hypothetical protein